MIRFEGVAKTFRPSGRAPVTALRGLDLRVERGECLCLVGASGCGKTTALRLINRLIEPTAGRVLVDGRDVRGLDPIRLRRGIGYVIQSGGLFPHLSAGDNVALLLRLEGRSPGETARRVEELLELVHLPPRDFAARFPAELSGGERQRVGVARALALAPPVVLLDEPFGALDPITRRELQAEFLELEERLETTTVLVTHDIDEAFRLGDRVGVMAGGAIEQVGAPDELRSSPASALVESLLEGHLS